jgi:Phytanoyl-CoA dioxygenase (PhyH)
MSVDAFEDALAAAGVRGDTLSGAECDALDRDGYCIFRGALADASLEGLRETFERCVLPGHLWPAPRESGTRHAMLDGEADVRAACLHPLLLAATRHYLSGRFYLSAVEGRDPMPRGGHQRLHRDWAEDRPCALVKALAFLDDFGADNGATRLIPGSHREPGDGSAFLAYGDDNPREIGIEGRAGDIFLFHGRLAHAGTRNSSGAKRRILQIWFGSHARYGARPDTRDLASAMPHERYLLGRG